MTSLNEAFSGPSQPRPEQRKRLGALLALVGSVLTLLGIVSGTTNITNVLIGTNTWQAWEIAGVLGGFGVVILMYGGFVLVPSENKQYLPADQKRRLTVLAGSLIAVAGVLFFVYAFPNRWHSDTPNLSLYVVCTYFIGSVTMLGLLFESVGRFRARNPSGSIVRNTKQKSRNVISLDRDESSESGFGSVGLIGDTPDEHIPTQTNRKSVQGRKSGQGDAEVYNSDE